MIPYYESPSIVHLCSTNTKDAVNGTFSLMDKTVLSRLLFPPVFTHTTAIGLVFGFHQKLAVFVTQPLAANCHQETFRFLFTSSIAVATQAMQILALVLASGQVTYSSKNIARCNLHGPSLCRHSVAEPLFLAVFSVCLQCVFSPFVLFPSLCLHHFVLCTHYSKVIKAASCLNHATML